jgi:hypothetical protein
VSGHHKSLFLKLFSDIPWGRARNLNPGFGENGTGDKHEADVESSVNRVEEGSSNILGRGHVVYDARGSMELRGSLMRFPDTEELDEEVVREARIEHLADEKDVGAEGRLQHDWHVGGVEEADRVRATHASLTGRLDGDFDTETLEVDDRCEDDEGREQIHDIGEVLAVECFLESALLVGPGEEEMEERDDSAFEFGTTTGVDGGGREGLPDNGFADIGGDEEGNAASETVALLEEFIEKDDDETCDNELDNKEDADTSTQL